MANSRFRSISRSKTPSSGTSDVPTILPYPELLPLDRATIRDLFCYVIRHYGTDGLAVLIRRDPANDDVLVVCGDWHGRSLDLTAVDSELAQAGLRFINNDLPLFLTTMSLIKLPQAQFFFACGSSSDPSGVPSGVPSGDQSGVAELTLVDMQVSANKLVGPGMVRDIFGKIYRTQDVIKTEIIDDRALAAIQLGSGSYSGNIILKPSKFRMQHDSSRNSYQPMYVVVER